MKCVILILGYAVAVILPRAVEGLFTECCPCDDFSPDPSQHCDIKGTCDNSYKICQEYCETTKQFVNQKWYKTRNCSQETTCVQHWYHTVMSHGCVQNTRGEPENGTTCYQCCKVPEKSSNPHFCLDHPDTNYVTFPVTTPTPTTTTKGTEPTTVTSASTAPPMTTRTTTTTTTTESTTSTSGSSGTVCEVGRDGVYTRATCDPATPLCMNTVVLQSNFTIIKKTCESNVLCNLDWGTLTRARPDCMKTDFASLPVRDEGLVCHYCCNSSNGKACNTEIIPANVKQLVSQVDGGWTVWTLWQGCTDDCKGIRVRIRTCSNPLPTSNGLPCVGDGLETENCNATNCHVAETATAGMQAIVG